MTPMRRRPTPNAKPPARATPPAKPAPATTDGRRAWPGVVAAVALVAAGALGWWLLRPDPLAQARAALDRRDFAAAAAALDARLASHPTDAEALLLAVRAARRAGDLARAGERLRAAERAGGATAPLAAENLLFKAQAGSAADAEAVYAGPLASPDPVVAAAAAEAYLEGRLRVLAPRADAAFDARNAEAGGAAKLRTALDVWDRYRTGTADRAQGLVWRGRVRVFENDHAAGVASLREAVALDPANADARWHLALALAQSSPPEAAAQLEALHARDPGDFRYRLGLAGAYRAQGRLVDAGRLLAELRAARPDDLGVLLEVAGLALDEGRVDDAGPTVARCLELAADAPPVLLLAARYHHLAGREADAARYRARFAEVEAARTRPK